MNAVPVLHSLVDGDDERTPDGKMYEVKNPSSGVVVRHVRGASRATVERTLALAQQSSSLLAATTRALRGAWLQGLRAGLVLQRSPLLAAIVEEAGKPIGLAEAEFARALHTCDAGLSSLHHSGDMAGALDQVPAGAGRYGIRRRFPVGVVVGITPFNFPLNLVMHKLVPAIVAGCPLVLKPAEQTPSAASMVMRIARDVGASLGIPAAAMSLLFVHRDDTDAMSALLGSPHASLISFTGSSAVGWSLRARVAPTRCVLELGGDAPVVIANDVSEDALADIAARIAASAFGYAGQSCISTQRVFVHAAVASRLESALVAATQALRMGDVHDKSTLVGPVINDAAAERFDALIADAMAHGARRLVGGGRHSRWCESTLLTAPTAHARLHSEEAFLPIATLASYDSDDEVAVRINASPYGLQAGVFGSLDTAWRFHAKLRVGAVLHNEVPSYRLDHMPYGGLKSSGDGFEGLPAALEHYTEPRLLVVRE
jgi:acyl-CoA reductase-like NAD-dependent aldehyde dehydrogenase